MKILVNCYACSPYKGSEPGMGWKFVNELSKGNKLHIITESKFEKDIRKYFNEYPEREGDFHFYFICKNRHKKLRKLWPPSYYWFYRSWQRKAYKLALELDAKENFDIVHQLNMAGYREPGYLWRMNKPFVWGPIGGFDNAPWCMLPSMGLKGLVFYSCYNIINWWQMHTNGRVRAAMRKADALIAATITNAQRIKTLFGKDCYLIPEVGFEGNADNRFAVRNDGEKLRLCWSGQHTPGKSLNLLIDALATISRSDVELHVIGKGSETEKWMRRAEKRGLKNVTWHGWVERCQALQIMQSCHLFCITSLKDLTSTVILEALSYGMPVITLDHCGFSNVITDECGRKVKIESKHQVVRGFAAAIAEMADNEPLRRKLSEGARQRALEYRWEDKAAQIENIYKAVLGK